MFQQTVELSKSLPNFAPWIEAADRKGSSDWEIVRWKRVSPSDVKSDHVKPLSLEEMNGEADVNRFESRTDALRASERITKQFKTIRSERGHWGVWRWVQNGETVFQTALPVNRSAARRSEVRPVADTPGGASGSMVRIGERAYRMLRNRADEEGMTIQATLEAAIDHYDRHRFFDLADRAYEALRSNPTAWADELAERREWDATLMDGIEADDYSSPNPTRKITVPERKSA